MKVAQLCPALCDPVDYTVHGILQTRILEWVAFPFSRGSSHPRFRTQISCIAGGFFTSWARREALVFSVVCLLIWSFSVWLLSACYIPGVRTPLGTTQSNLLPSWSLHSSEGRQETNLQKTHRVPGGDTCDLGTFRLKRAQEDREPEDRRLSSPPPRPLRLLTSSTSTPLTHWPPAALEQQTRWFAVSAPSVLCLPVWWFGDLVGAVTSAWRVLQAWKKASMPYTLRWEYVSGSRTAARPVVWVKGVWGDGIGEQIELAQVSPCGSGWGLWLFLCVSWGAMGRLWAEEWFDLIDVLTDTSVQDSGRKRWPPWRGH